VASPVQIHQSVQILKHVLLRYTNPSKCCGKSCSHTPIRPNVASLLYSNDYVYELQNSFHTFSYRVQLKTEPGRTATSTAIHYKHYTGLLLPHVTVVTEVTFSPSQTRLTPGEQIIKNCLKLLPINCPYYTSSLMKAARLSPPVIGVYMEHYIIIVTQPGLICCAQHTSIWFVSIQQFNREDLQCRNPHKGRNRIKSVAENSEQGFPVLQVLRNQARLRAERSHLQHV